jgi:hypothetical protein
MIPEGFDKLRSCGEPIRFVPNPLTGNMMPECAHGNHFLDCPDRRRYRREIAAKDDKAAGPGQKSLEAWGGTGT